MAHSSILQFNRYLLHIIYFAEVVQHSFIAADVSLNPLRLIVIFKLLTPTEANDSELHLVSPCNPNDTTLLPLTRSNLNLDIQPVQDHFRVHDNWQ